MEAFKEMHRHKRNKEHRQEQIACFKKVWTTDNIFGRSERDDIKWHLTPPQEFLPQELGAWMIPPIHIRRQSPSPGLEADFVVQHNFLDIVHDFLTEYSNNLPATQHATQPDNEHPNTTDPPQSQQVEPQATERPESFRNNLEGREEGRDRQRAVGLPPNGQDNQNPSRNTEDVREEERQRAVGLPPNGQQQQPYRSQDGEDAEDQQTPGQGRLPQQDGGLPNNSYQHRHQNAQETQNDPPQRCLSLPLSPVHKETLRKLGCPQTKTRCNFGPKSPP